MKVNTLSYLKLCYLTLALFVSVIQLSYAQETPTKEKPEQVARAAVEFISKKDWLAFTTLIHPKDGVRFAPYAFISELEGVVIQQKNFLEFTKSDKKTLWGEYEGSGDDIKLSWSAYYQDFLYAAPYLSGKQGNRNQELEGSSTVNNILKIYKPEEVAYYEFHLVDTVNDGWRTLRVVTKKADTGWFVVALVNDGVGLVEL